MKPLIEMRGIVKTYNVGKENELEILHGIDLTVWPGEFVATAQRNVELPMLYAGVPARDREARATQLLRRVGMEQRRFHQPSELSGGQKQRVAIARSLVNDPAILLADEPTGALDSQTSRHVMDIFHDLHRQGKTIVLITHSRELADECPRVITLRDGRILADQRKEGTSHAAF